jgi:hypothetical protein
MKRISILMALCTGMLTPALAQQTMYIYQKNGTTAVEFSQAGDMMYDKTARTLTIAGTTYSVSNIDSISFRDPIEAKNVLVTYNGSAASVVIPTSLQSKIKASISGANVAITSTQVDGEEVTYELTGTSGNGSFTFDGSYKCTLLLNGLNLTSTTGAALDIESGKRTELQLADGTTNTLVDAAGGSQKAALYCKGHLELSGGGSLTLTGNTKHALSTKEYCLIKKSVGALTVLSAQSDGIHAGQYFRMNGGIVVINNVGGDAIQAEVTDDPTDENNGQLFVRGGSITTTLTAEDSKGLKADGLITISGGTIEIQANGNGSRGIQTDGSMCIDETEGTTAITIAANGGKCTQSEDADDPHKCMGIKVDGDLTIDAGTITVTNTGKKSKGIKVGGTYTHNGGTVTASIDGDAASTALQTANFNIREGAELHVLCSSSDSEGLLVENSGTIDGGEMTFSVTSTESKAVKASQNLVINGGKMTFTVSGNASKGISAETLSVNGGAIGMTLSGAPIVTNYDPSYCSGIKSTTYTQTDGTITMTHTGTAGKGISIDGVGTFAGGTVTITTSGAAGTYKSSASASDSYAASCIKGDGNLYLNAGTFTLKSTGTGGKCIKGLQQVTLGDDTNRLALSATTTGSKYGGNSSGFRAGWGGGGGGWNPGGNSGGGTTSSVSASAKAIKAQGTLTVNSGTINVSTSTDGAEGMESKTSITVNGGDIYIKAYDDCINSSGTIVFNGGRTYCWGTGNDAIDSNSSASGAITINGGIVLALSAKGSPEEGIDCDNAAVKVNGGYLFTMGSAQSSTPSVPTTSTATQPTALLKSLSLTSGQYLTVSDKSGTNIFTFKLPFTLSGCYSLLTAPSFTKGSTYYVKTGTTAPTDATSEWNGFYLGSTCAGTTTKKTISFSANYVAL